MRTKSKMKLKTKKPGCRHIKRQWQRKSNKLCQWLLDNSWICQLADWISRRLDISRTTQLMDPPAVAVLVVITLIYGHLCPVTACPRSNKYVRLPVLICCLHYHAIKTETTSTTSGSIHARVVWSTTCPVCEMSNLQVGNLRVVQLPCQSRVMTQWERKTLNFNSWSLK